MDRKTSLPLFLLGALAIAACGGGSGDAEAPMEEAEPAATEVATADVSGLEGCFIQRGTAAESQDRPSPLRSTAFATSAGEGLLCYGAPSANGREIMGALVPYGQPWRAGANEATAFHLSAPTVIGGVALEPGSYSMYVVPGEGDWEVFINSNAERWGIPINDDVRANEVGSFTVTPEAIPVMAESLLYRFQPNAEGTMGDMVMEWENTRISFHIHPGNM